MGDRGRDIVSTWDGFAETIGGRVSIASGGRRFTWEQFAERANRMAWHLESEAGLARGERVAIALPNLAEYLEVFYAALKLGCVPVNIDVGLATPAIHAILDHSDAKVVVHSPEDAKAIGTAAKRIARPWRPLPLPVGEVYERGVAGAPSSTEWQPIGGAPDDVVVLYADATAVPPTGLMWRSGDLADAVRAAPDPGRDDATPTVVLTVAPLTHTLGFFGALRPLMSGDTVALVRVDPFDRPAVWNTVERERVTVLELPSDGAAAKLADTLAAEPRRWDLSRLETVTCAGRFRDATRDRLLAHLPIAAVTEQRAPVARTANEMLRVIDDTTGRDVEPGTGQVGVVAVGGAVPLGYYKDPEKTSLHFRTIGGSRYWLSGERATVDSHHAIRRTAAESEAVIVDGARVSASTVELVLRKHPSVAACVVVGIRIPPTSVQQLVALVEVVARHHLDEPEMTAWCRSQLTAPQTPSRFLFVDSVAAVTTPGDDRVAAQTLATDLLRRHQG